MGLLHYPRGIINPNYPGFQHLAHTLADHFIDHQFDQSSDSEISDDSDSDSYPSGHTGGKNLTSDDNNNGDGEMEDIIDLNSNLGLPPTMSSTTTLFSKRAKQELDFTSSKLGGCSNYMDFNEDDDFEYVLSDENIDCDSDAYVQYDFKPTLNKLQIRKIDKIEENFRNDRNSMTLLTPDILIEHKSSEKPLKRISLTTGIRSTVKNIAYKEINQEDKREYAPDLIKHIINDYDQDKVLNATLSDGGNNMQKEEGNDNNIRNSQNVIHSLPLSFESATSSTVDIIGDFGKEIENEISMIVSGFRDTANETNSIESMNDQKMRERNSRQNATTSDEFVLDENKFMEHLKSFTKVSFKILRYFIRIRRLLKTQVLFLTHNFIEYTFAPYNQLKKLGQTSLLEEWKNGVNSIQEWRE